MTHHDTKLARSIRDLLERRTGLDLAQCRTVDFTDRLADAARTEAIHSVNEAWNALASGGPVADRLAQTLLSSALVHETSFYRFPAQLDVLERHILPVLLRGRTSPLRIWSAGCSRGPEAYTLAMVALRARNDVSSRAPLEVLGTDLNETFLAEARRATYDASTLQDLPASLRNEHLSHQTGGSYRVNEPLRHLVRFQQHNLRDIPPGRDFDVVCCRNVLMYLQQDAARDAVVQLARSLSTQGALLVGHGDSLRSHHDVLTVDAQWTVGVYRKVSHEAKVAERAPKRSPIGVRQGRKAATAQPTRSPRITHRTVILRGIYDASAAPSRTDALQRELADGLEAAAVVVIEADDAESLDTATARMIARAAGAAALGGGRVVVRASRPAVRRWATRHGLPLDVPGGEDGA